MEATLDMEATLGRVESGGALSRNFRIYVANSFLSGPTASM